MSTEMGGPKSANILKFAENGPPRTIFVGGINFCKTMCIDSLEALLDKSNKK